MQEQSHSGRHLPGWGAGIRTWRSRTGRTALVLAAVAGLALTGCNGTSPGAAQVNSTNNVSINSQPAKLHGALSVAMQHLDLLYRAASNPFHLVAFRGQGLDDNGATVQASGSQWEFTFSRYAEPFPSQKYEVATVLVPGTGATHLSVALSEDATLSPIENWDAANDSASPDSSDFLAHLKTLGVQSVAGATLTLTKGIVTVQAGGKTVAYDAADGTYNDHP